MSTKKSKPNSDSKEIDKRLREVQEKRHEEQIEHKFRMRFDWDNLIEDKIQEGKDKGIFEKLKGRGKPLNLSKNPFGKEKELAHSLLKDNKMTPAWIGSRKVIMDAIELLREDMKKRWKRHEREYRLLTDPRYRDSLILSWDDHCRRWVAEIEDINKLIEAYNLKRPIDNLEILKLSLERELKRLDARRWLKQFE